MAPRASSPHSLATASGLLLGTPGAAMRVGALIGAAFGCVGDRPAVGALVGIPLGVAVVYWVYSPCRERRRERGRVLDAAADAGPPRCRRSPAPVVILLALPVFAIAGWPLAGWALAAVLWIARRTRWRATDAAAAGCG